MNGTEPIHPHLGASQGCFFGRTAVSFRVAPVRKRCYVARLFAHDRALLTITAAAVLATLALPVRTLGEPAPLPARMQPVAVDSGVLANPTNRAQVVFSKIIDLGPDVPWVRVLFDPQGTNLPPGSSIRVTSLLDGETQTLDAQDLENWGYGTAFFNGSSVRIEIIAAPGSVGNRIDTREVYAGDPTPEPLIQEPDGQGTVAGICGALDSRVPNSPDKRVGRLLPGTKSALGTDPYCTAFLVDTPGDDKLHLTAGHCFGNYNQNMTSPFILEIDVPQSNPNCTIVHPGVADQFPVNGSTVISTWPGFDPKPPGNDWAVFRCHPQNGETTYTRNGGVAFPIAAPPPINTPVRVTGCGIDGGDITMPAHAVGAGLGACAAAVDTNTCGRAGCHHCDPNTMWSTRNGTRQTDTGTLVANTVGDKGTVLSFTVDICAANSGSPIIMDSDSQGNGGKVVGIVTHAGCKGGDAHNHGQPITTTPALMNAISHEFAVKTAVILVEGPATAFGSFQFKMVERNAPCTDPFIPPQRTLSYDQVAGGEFPTTATEIRDNIIAGLNPPPVGYIIYPIPNDKLGIQSTWKAAADIRQFDVCVGKGAPIVYTRVIGNVNDQFDSQKGVKITGVTKDKFIPAVSTWGLIALALVLLTAGTIVMRNRRAYSPG